MAKGRASASKAANRRGSPEAVEKRRAARLFNDVLGGRGASLQKLDGRTEKRRQRLLEELETGTTRGARELKPLDVLRHVQELLEMGEPLSALRKVARVRHSVVPADAVVDIVKRLHKAYNFRPETYRFLGIAADVLRNAGVIEVDDARKAKPKKRA